MELRDVIKTFELENADRDHLNGFLKNGWRIIETLKVRVTDGEVGGAFDDQIKYVLGTNDGSARFGDSYQKKLDDMEAYFKSQKM
jgi:hypothetical protein